MDKKISAILLRAVDSKDYDKTVELFCAEEGLITATMRGARKPTAKLKFACQPFSFCLYELVEKNGRYSVTGATAIEDMFALTRNTDAYVCASATLECVQVCARAVESEELFLILIKTLKTYLYARTNPYVVLAKFAQKVLSISGFSGTDYSSKTYVTPDKIETAADVLAYIKGKYMDELEAFRPIDEIATAAAISELSRFSRLFDTPLSSLKFIQSLYK